MIEKLFALIIIYIFFVMPYLFVLKKISQGWVILADKFETKIPAPKKYDFRAAFINIRNSNVLGLTKIAMLEEGLYISIIPIMAFYNFKRRLLIPWAEISTGSDANKRQKEQESIIYIKSLATEIVSSHEVIATISEYMKYNVREQN